jgi:hypothetical protein
MSSNQTRRRRSKKKIEHLSHDDHDYKRYKGDRRKDEPFSQLVAKTAGVLAITCIAIYSIFNMSNDSMGRSQNADNAGGEEGYYAVQQEEQQEEDVKSTIFPSFELGEEFNYDIYGIIADSKDQVKSTQFLDLAESLIADFADRWGGENAARAILIKGLTTFAPSAAETISSSTNEVKIGADIPRGLLYTAKRIKDAKVNGKSFKISFAGSSAVTGRGNFFDQNFPSIVASNLIEPFGKLGIELEVRNAAIDGIGSFPFGWCMKNYLGHDVDVVSWDPEMTNRGDTNAAFEAYLRNAIAMDHSPMIIIREYAYTVPRRELLQKYVDLGVIGDPIVINIEAAVAPFKDLDESITPANFKDWLDFGAPAGAPGKTRTNLSLQQHQLMGDLLTMHFLAAAALAAREDLPKDIFNIGPTSKSNFKHYLLPQPQSSDLEYDTASRNSTLMFGSPVPADQHWYMNEIHCKSSFDPVITGELSEIIISGTDAEDIDLLLPKGPMLYNRNWVMDYGPVAKTLANSVQQYNLGYQDRRKGYFGVQPSGKLSMFIPYEFGSYIQNSKQLDAKRPNELFKTIVICEVNERADCKMENDVSFVLGGIAVNATAVEANGASYNGKKICIALPIPEAATWAKRMQPNKKGRLLLRQRVTEEKGLSLDMSVSNNLLFWKNGPCSISHVIWEQFRNLNL